MPSPVKEGIMITVLPNNSVSGNQTLTSQETKEATAIIDFISEGFESIGIGIGHADLQVIKYPGRGYPQFCSKLLNAELSADLIYLDMDSFAYPNWCQFVYQFSHEFTHCVIHRCNNRNNQLVSWIEETICEAMALILLKRFSEDWSKCSLSNSCPKYKTNFLCYLSNCLSEKGNYRLDHCNGFKELQEINVTSEDQREDRREEMHQLYRLIQSADDIRGLCHYRDFLVPQTILLNTQRYQKAYLSSQPIHYLCRLQENALMRDVPASKFSEKSSKDAKIDCSAHLHNCSNRTISDTSRSF